MTLVTRSICTLLHIYVEAQATVEMGSRNFRVFQLEVFCGYYKKVDLLVLLRDIARVLTVGNRFFQIIALD